MIKITSGIIHRALRLIIAGVPGVGKSKFASHFPKSVFIDLENGTDSMDVARTPKPKKWEELHLIIKEILADPTLCKTLVLDTGDWAEMLCIDYICRKHKVEGIESIGYGKGYTYLKEEFKKLLELLDQVIAAGINVVICAHVQIRKFELPDEAGSFDRYELKMSKQVTSLVREWCDILLFANYKTYVISNNGKNKATGGTKRVMYANHSATWDAKNRHGLPDEMDFDFKEIAHLFQEEPSPTEKVKKMLSESGVTEEELRQVVASKNHYPLETPISEYSDRFVTGWIIPYWDKILPIIHSNRETK